MKFQWQPLAIPLSFAKYTILKHPRGEHQVSVSGYKNPKCDKIWQSSRRECPWHDDVLRYAKLFQNCSQGAKYQMTKLSALWTKPLDCKCKWTTAAPPSNHAFAVPSLLSVTSLHAVSVLIRVLRWQGKCWQLGRYKYQKTTRRKNNQHPMRAWLGNARKHKLLIIFREIEYT